MSDIEQTGIPAVSDAAPRELIVSDPMDSLIQMAISKDLDVEKLDKLISMKNREEERHCKKDFDFHFSEMRKEFTPMKRSKRGDKGMYAPIDEFQKKYDPIITAHGFWYSWDEKTLDNGELLTTMTISGYGHSKSNSKLLPVYTPDKGSSSGKAIMNPLQAEGVRTTYNQRYTFKDGFGITETDEDQDANLTFDDGVTWANEIMQLRGAATAEDLVATWKFIYKALNGEGKEVVGAEYRKLKAGFLKKGRKA